MPALTLFYSYSHKDEALREQLETHLVQLQRQGLIAPWHDRKISPGDTWANEIDTHLETASIILLLVSPDFLASNYCYDIEMQRALERHRLGLARVIPIILRPCDWQHSPLKDLQCLPRDGKPIIQWPYPDEAFNTITQSLHSIIEQQTRPFVPLLPLDRQNRIRMLKQVRTIWIDGLLKQSLHNAARIELSLQDRPDVLANSWQLQYQELDQSPQSLPDGTTIVQVYDRANGELLILGEPGAGKTTLLLELARTLIEQAEKDERFPMPIVFNLSSWAEKRQPLHMWLVEELWMKYQVSRKIGQGWVETDQVLPLLDGLDEVAKDVRSTCVEQINEYYQARLERGSSPIVVCCRSEEYASFAKSHSHPKRQKGSKRSKRYNGSKISESVKLRFQQAVCIQPLTDEQVNSYLERIGEQTKVLRQALNKDDELRKLAHLPLMLNILTLAYQGAQASDVPTGETREGMQHTIFAKYVERMLKRREQSKRWKPEQVIHWLTFLARQMRQHDQTVFSVENLQSTWLSRRQRILYQCCIGLLTGLVFELLFGLATRSTVGLVFGPIAGLVAGLVFGLGGGLVAGLVFGLTAGLNTGIKPVEALTWSPKGARSRALSVMVFGLAAGLVKGPVFALAAGLAGLGYGLLGGLQGRQLSERLSLSPNEGIWRSGKTGLFIGLCVGLVMELFEDWVTGLVFGLFLGLFLGLRAFVMHFILRLFLSWRSDLPWDVVAFLDEASDRLLLRKVGGSYIFVHRMLLDYFADLEVN